MNRVSVLDGSGGATGATESSGPGTAGSNFPVRSEMSERIALRVLEAQQAKELGKHIVPTSQPHSEVVPSLRVPENTTGIQPLQSRGELAAPPGMAARVLERMGRLSGGAGATTPTPPLLVGSRPHTPAGSEAISSEVESSRQSPAGFLAAAVKAAAGKPLVATPGKKYIIPKLPKPESEAGGAKPNGPTEAREQKCLEEASALCELAGWDNFPPDEGRVSTSKEEGRAMLMRRIAGLGGKKAAKTISTRLWLQDWASYLRAAEADGRLSEGESLKLFPVCPADTEMLLAWLSRWDKPTAMKRVPEALQFAKALGLDIARDDTREGGARPRRLRAANAREASPPMLIKGMEQAAADPPPEWGEAGRMVMRTAYLGSAMFQMRGAGVADMGISAAPAKSGPGMVISTVQGEDKLRRKDVELFAPAMGVFSEDLPWMEDLVKVHSMSKEREWLLPDWEGPDPFAPGCNFRRDLHGNLCFAKEARVLKAIELAIAWVAKQSGAPHQTATLEKSGHGSNSSD